MTATELLSGIPLIISHSEKKAFHLNGLVFSTKVTIEDTIFTSPTGEGTAIYVILYATRRSSPLQGKGNTFVSQSFLRP